MALLRDDTLTFALAQDKKVAQQPQFELVTDVMSEFEVFEFLEKMAELLG